MNRHRQKHTSIHCYNQNVSNIWYSCKLARKRKQMHVAPTHSEEDDEGEEPKDHCSRTADFGSQSPNQPEDHNPIPTCSLEGLHEESPYWEQPTNSSASCSSNVIGTMTGTGWYGQVRQKLNFLAMYTPQQKTEQELNKCHPETSCATICWFTFAAVNYLGKRQKQGNSLI